MHAEEKYLLNIHTQLLDQMIKDVLASQVNRTFKKKKKNPKQHGAGKV